MMGRRLGQKVGPYIGRKQPIHPGGARLRELRVRKHMTAQQLADAAGLTKTSLLRLELTLSYCDDESYRALIVALPELQALWPTPKYYRGGVSLRAEDLPKVQVPRHRTIERPQPVKSPRTAGSTSPRTFSDRQKSRKST